MDVVKGGNREIGWDDAKKTKPNNEAKKMSGLKSVEGFFFLFLFASSSTATSTSSLLFLFPFPFLFVAPFASSFA